MARTILEDYTQDTESHFELAYKIPRRAREIHRRADARVAERNDKPIVVALREISERASHYEEDAAVAPLDGAAADEAASDAAAPEQQEDTDAPEQGDAGAPEQG